VNRRRLLTGVEPVEKAMETGSSVAGQGDPAGEIGAAWSVKERLRILLKERELSKIRGRPVDYDDALDAACPRPLGWPRPSRSDGRQSWLTSPMTSPTLKTQPRDQQTTRVGCGFRNMDNYQRRILSQIAVTRPQQSAA
jgi:transposase